MNKRISLGLAISLVAIGCAITFILTWTVSLGSYNTKIASAEKYEGVYRKLKEMDATVRTNYIGDLDNDALEAAIISGYVNGIGDEYATFLTADMYYDYQQTNSGVINGAGFEAAADGSGYLKISRIYTNSSADINGVKVGDMITEINGRSLLSMNADAALKLISGEVGTKLSLRLVSNGEERSVTLIRQQIDVESVTYKMLENNIGYIKISSFNAKTPEQFSNALNSLNSSGAKAFIFDVRHNDGGLMSAVKPMLNRLIPAAAVATAEYTNGVRKTLIETDSEESMTLPVTVLTDNLTASAAEVFAVGLRDEQGAQLIGTQTAGKAVLQSAYEFSDGSALILTTASIIPSKSDKFGDVGLKPDYIIELPADTPFDVMTQDADAQLQKAIEILTPKAADPSDDR
ncbi:MAG: PDZ domain-containing protein [Oscillospiraceae bacterium]|nr:PDZ domain-containing protein [Oscillospiraceae bacterium]